MNRHTNVPMTEEEVASLKTGDYMYLTGTIYTAGNAAHERIDEALDRGESLPSDTGDSTMYYMEPSPIREERTIGSAGPTTANRMDKYTPRLLDLGMGATIGKGRKSKTVMDTVVRNGAVYFAAVGGAGAILSKCILSSEIVAYEDLDAETVRRLATQDFPVVVVMGTLGNSLYKTAVEEFCTLWRGDMKRIIYMVLMNLLHAPIWFFTISHIAREKDIRTTAEKYGYISEMVERINRRGRVTITATGIEHIPSQDRFILFPNHQGLFDMLTLFSTCPRPLSIVIEKEASNWILVKQVLGATKSLAMDRDDIKDQVCIITEVIKQVKSGRNFVIFAKGHRSRNGNEILDFKSGTFKSVVKAGYPTVSMALANSFRSFDMSSLKGEEAQVRYMEPILPGQYVGMEASEIAHLVHNRVQEEINKNPTKNGLTN